MKRRLQMILALFLLMLSGFGAMQARAEKGFRYYKLEFTATQGAGIIQLEEIDLLDADGNPIETMKVYKDSFGKGEAPRLSDNNMDTKWGGSFGGYAYVLMDTEEPTTPAGYRFYTGDDTESQPGRNPKSWKLYGCFAASEPGEEADWTLLDERTDDETMQPVNLTPFDFTFTYEYTAMPVEPAYQAYEAYAQELIDFVNKSEGDGSSWEMLKSYLEESSQPGNPFPNGSYPYIMANRQLSANEVYQEIAYLRNLFDEAQNDMLLPGYRYYKLEFTANMGDPVIQLQEIDLLDANGNPIESMKVYKDSYGQGDRLSDNNMGTKWGGGFGDYAYVLMKTSVPTSPAGYRFYTGDDTEACPGRNPKNWKLYGCFAVSDPDEEADWTLLDEHEDDETLQPVNLTPFDFFFDYEYTVEPSYEQYQAYEDYVQQIIASLSAVDDIEDEAIDLLRTYLDEMSEPGSPFPHGSYTYIMKHMQLTPSGVRQEMAYLQSLYDAAQNAPGWPGFRYFKLEFTATQGAEVIQLEEIDLLDADGNPIETMKVYKDSYAQGDHLSDNNMNTKWGGGFGGYAYLLIDAGQKVMPKSYRLYTGDDTQTQSGRNPRSWKLSGGNTYCESPEEGTWTQMDEHTDDYTMQAVNLTPFDFAINYIYTEQERIAKAYEDYKAYADELLAALDELAATGEAAERLYIYLKDDVEPGETFANGSFNYIIYNEELNAEQLAAEMAFMAALYQEVQATNYGVGDVSFLLKDVPFSNIVQERGGGSFDDSYTLTELKNGFYEVRMNGLFTLRTREDSRFYATYLYAGDHQVPLMSIQEDYIPDEETEDYGAGDLTFSEHYIPASSIGVRTALKDGHYENTIVAEVTDGTLRIGILGLGTGNSEDWSVYGYVRLSYLGEAASSGEALTKALAGQAARAQSLLDKEASSGTDCCYYPNFSQTLREQLQALCTTATQTSDAAAMYETEGAFSAIYPEVLDCQKAYIGMMNRADAYITKLSEMMEANTIGKTLFDYGLYTVNDIFTAYEEGTYSAEEARGVKFYDFNRLRNPLIANAGQFSSNASDSEEGKDLGALVDDNAKTLWHSDFHGQSADDYHYLQVNLEELFMGEITLLVLRPEASADHPTKMLVWGSEDGNDFTELDTLDIPFSGAGMMDIAAPFIVNTPVNYLRLAAADCASTDGTAFRKSWQAAELQIYSKNYLRAGFRYFMLEFTANMGDPIIQLQEIDLLDGENPIESMKVYKDSFGEGPRLSDNNMGTKWGGLFNGVAYVFMDTETEVAPTGYRFYTGDDTQSQTGRNPKSWRLYGSNDYSESAEEGNWTLLDERTDDNTLQPVNLTPFDFAINYQYSVGIKNVQSQENTMRREGIYDLMGRRLSDSVENLSKGLYIINGKKVLMK
ncbi:MAG: discoidin domain-containing protein [Bacteroidaceae bacterium]|nr:discoidin domain-containing protein [Bacteroidaceae bacterium]